MNFQYKRHLITLFNIGVLSMMSAEWYQFHGYAVICRAGRVIDIAEEEK